MKWLKIIAGAAAGLYAFYYFAFPTYTHRFRLTFQVEVDGKVKEGAGVITVMDQDNQWVPLTQKRWSRTAKGPSPWIDLGDRGVLLVSMGSLWHAGANYAADLSFAAYFAEHGHAEITSLRVRDIHRQIGARTLRDDQMPPFIWIERPHDPNSARILSASNLSDVIGPNVRFLKLTVEITKDRADSSIYGKLPWLAAMCRGQFWSGKPWTKDFQLGAVDILGGL
jgi:hypothetical protein